MNTTTSAVPGTPSAPTMPRASAATASPGFTGMGSTVCPKVRGAGLIGVGAALGLFLSLAVSSCHCELCLWTLCLYCLNQSLSNLQVLHKSLRNEHVSADFPT